MTPYGERQAYRLIRTIAGGATVVSGMALAATLWQQTAPLDAGAATAVLGCGIDRYYPPEHVLAEHIIKME